MMWLDTKEEVDFGWFMEVLDNDELQVVSRKLTEEDKKELSRQIAECRVIRQETLALESACYRFTANTKIGNTQKLAQKGA